MSLEVLAGIDCLELIAFPKSVSELNSVTVCRVPSEFFNAFSCCFTYISRISHTFSPHQSSRYSHLLIRIEGVRRLPELGKPTANIEGQVFQGTRRRCGGQRIQLWIRFTQMTGSFDSQRWETGSAGGGSGGGYDGGLRRRTERELTQGIIRRRRGHGWRQRVLRVLYNWLLWWSKCCRGLGRGSAYIVRP